MKNWPILLLINICTFIFCSDVFASCAFQSKTGYMTARKTLAMPISANISVPPGTPIGQVVYRQVISLENQTPFNIECTVSGQYHYSLEYASLPRSASTYNSKIYTTNISGIGVQIVSTLGMNSVETPFPYSAPSTLAACASAKICGFTSGYTANTRIHLIKIANTVSPGTLNATSLPTIKHSYGQSGNLVETYRISLTGTINITSPTCNISTSSSNMSVSMGKELATAFTGVGSSTPWVNASIVLSDCPYFYGNSKGINTMKTYNGTTLTETNAQKNNTARVSLTPRSGILDSTNGIIKITDHPYKAKGIGIQISTNTDINGAGKFNLSQEKVWNLTMTGLTKITLPLYARYIQTESTVSGGKANGSLEYTITYQ